MSSSEESVLSRYVALPGLILSSIITTLLMYGAASGQTSSGAFYHYVTTHRASTQLIVQVLSHLLGAFLVLTLTTIVNFRTRLTLTQRTISLHHLSWWNQICNQRLNFQLPWFLCCFLIMFYAITLIPGALWAGAITPLQVTTPKRSVIDVPIYNADPQGLYWNVSRDWPHGAQNTTTNAFGDFSFLPVYPLGGRIMGTASGASASNRVANQTHPKYDNTRYAYNGRSYGVGSSVGITGDVVDLPNLARYSYGEIGYKADVTCAVNHTSLWSIQWVSYDGLSGTPQIYYAFGPLPNSNPGTYKFDKGNISTTFDAEPVFSFPTLGWYSNIEMVGIGALSRNGRNIFSFATRGTGSFDGQLGKMTKYQMLNNVQCEVTFTARTFNVDVDVNQRLINVTDVGYADESAFDPTVDIAGYGNRMIAQAAINQTGLLNPIYSTLYTSVVGDVFVSNVQNLYRRANITGSSLSNFTNTALNLQGIAETFESVLDDILVSLSSAQLVLSANGRRKTLANAMVNAVQVGQGSYIYGIAALNFVIVALFTFEVVRTRGWTHLPKFNYNSLTSVAVAASIGGVEIGRQAASEHSKWHADEQDFMTGKIGVHLAQTDTGVALISSRAAEKRKFEVTLSSAADPDGDEALALPVDSKFGIIKSPYTKIKESSWV